MSAPRVDMRGARPASVSAAALGAELYSDAMVSLVALSDGAGCASALRERRLRPPSDRLVEGGRRVAIDLVQHRARRFEALRAAAQLALDAAGRGAASGADPRAALARISDLLADAIAAASD